MRKRDRKTHLISCNFFIFVTNFEFKNLDIGYIILIEDSSNEAEISSVWIPYHFINYTADKKIRLHLI